MKNTSCASGLLMVGFVFFLLGIAGCTDEGRSPGDPDTGPEPISFARQIQPILDNNCTSCHGLDGFGGLDLRDGLSWGNLVRVTAQTSSGTLVTPGDPNASVLVNRLQANGLGIMPPTGSLDPTTVEWVLTWISEGANNN